MFEYLERADEIFVDAHHGAAVVKFASVVGCGEDGDELTFGEEFVSVFNYLMCATDEVKAVFMEELGDDGFAKYKGYVADVVFCPSDNVGVGVGPEEVAYEAIFGDIVDGARDIADVVETVKMGGETAMHAKNAVVNECGDG